MFYKQTIIIIASVFLMTNYLTAESKSIDLNKLNGNWHLRIMDGMEVRKARAILDFNIGRMKLTGFDGCNRIGGTLEKNSGINISVSTLLSTRMACREHIHSWVSKRLHETIKDGFGITENRRNGVDGITIKSPSHNLFFKKMGN